MTAETEAPKFQIVPFHQIVSLLEQNLATLCQLLPCKKYPREVPEQHHFAPPYLTGQLSAKFPGASFLQFLPLCQISSFPPPWSVWPVERGVLGGQVRLPKVATHLISPNMPRLSAWQAAAPESVGSFLACVWQTVSSCNFGLSSTILNRRTVLLTTWPLALPGFRYSACGPRSLEDVLDIAYSDVLQPLIFANVTHLSALTLGLLAMAWLRQMPMTTVIKMVKKTLMTTTVPWRSLTAHSVLRFTLERSSSILQLLHYKTWALKNFSMCSIQCLWVLQNQCTLFLGRRNISEQFENLSGVGLST